MIIVANWKSNKTPMQALAWLEQFLEHYRPHPDLEIIIAPPMMSLVPMSALLKQKTTSTISLAAQDISPFPLGSYTGAVAAEMVRDLVSYVIVGHAERRRYFHETNQEVANKAMEAAVVDIIPIVCVDLPYAGAQLAALDQLDSDKMIIGYGPVEAIGIDIPQPFDKAAAAVGAIHEILPDSPILYGGSISSRNITSYAQIPGIAGLMVGTASLQAEDFASLCSALTAARSENQ
jgi:triosephosphate isomerase